MHAHRFHKHRISKNPREQRLCTIIILYLTYLFCVHLLRELLNYYICASSTSYQFAKGQLCLQGKDPFLANETSTWLLLCYMMRNLVPLISGGARKNI
jgi:hypothetical protein